MPLPEQNIEREFALISLALDLRKYPEKAFILALNYYEDYMSLADDYKQLQKDFERLQIENIRLKSLTNHRSPSLPLWIKSNRGES